MARCEAVADVLNGFVEILIALPDCAETGREHADRALLFWREPVPSLAGVKGGSSWKVGRWSESGISASSIGGYRRATSNHNDSAGVPDRLALATGVLKEDFDLAAWHRNASAHAKHGFV